MGWAEQGVARAQGGLNRSFEFTRSETLPSVCGGQAVAIECRVRAETAAPLEAILEAILATILATILGKLG